MNAGSSIATTRRLRRHSLAAVVAVPALLISLTACGDTPLAISGTVGPAGVTPSATATAPAGSASTPAASGSSAPASTTTATSGRGCAAGGTKVPASAKSVRSLDLDGDGRKDTLWLADLGSKRTLGVRTASGAGFSTTFSSAAPQAASAIAGRITGSSIILLDTGRSVQVYGVSGCAIVPTRNTQGRQYSFDKGFTGYGTGVGCPTIGSGPQLAGYLAKAVSGGAGYDVTRTTVLIRDGGRRAVNGSRTTLGKGLPGSSKIVRTAMTVTCGASPQVGEPQS